MAWLARRLSRPVRWVETRSESMLGLGHGRGQIQDVTIGGSRDGTVSAYRLEVIQDAGAYPSLGAFLPFLTRIMLTGTYAIERAEFSSRSVVTNTTPMVAYRGAGRPEATAAIERAVDLFAVEIGMDPAEVRRRNLVGSRPLPVHHPHRHDVRHRRLRAARSTSCWRRPGTTSCARSRPSGAAAGQTLQLGLGLSVYVEITNGVPGSEFSSVEVRPDGKVVVKTGTSAHGQGHATAWSMLVAEKLGLAIEDVEFIQSDTDLVARGVGTFGSRSLQTGGVAARQAATQVVDMAKELAADLLEANPDDIVVDPAGGGLHVAGTPAVGPELGRAGPGGGRRRAAPLLAEVDFTPPGPTFPFGAHLAVVDVDIETGKAVLRRMVAVDDAGRILNPLLAEGQVHGGLAQGVAQALLEEFRYDEDGNPLTTQPGRLPFISATELPSFETRSDGDADAASTSSGPRGSASPARSARRRRSRTPWSTPWPTSACATSTCPPPLSGSGGPSPLVPSPAPGQPCRARRRPVTALVGGGRPGRSRIRVALGRSRVRPAPRGGDG